MITLRSLEELDRDHGTVKLLDDSHRFKSKANSDIVLVPQPADDPNDPLNWPAWKKNMALVAALLSVFLPAWVVGGVGSGLLLVIEDFDSTLNATVDALITWPALLLGLSVFFWVPLIQYIGVRPAALLGGLVTLITCFWAGGAHSLHSLEASRIIGAWAMSCGEILPGIVVRDIFFLHERGSRMGLYMMFFQVVPTLGTIASGFLITAGGWRWHFWLCGIVASVAFFFMLLFLPETQYHRPTADGASSLRSSSTEDQSTPGEQKLHETGTPDESAVPPARKTFTQDLRLFSGFNPGGHKENFAVLFLRPFPLTIIPAIIYPTLVLGVGVSILLCLVDTAASVFQAPPYLFSPGIQSLMYLPNLVGGILGCLWGGYGTDLYCKYRASKNNGVFEPENRLVMAIFPGLITAAGTLIYGYAVTKSDPWPVAWIAGIGFFAFGHNAIPTLSLAYAVDSYYPVSPEALNLIIAYKNIISFGFSYAIVPWLGKWGFERVFGTMAGLYLLFAVVFAIPLYYFGKTFREVIAKWKIILW